MALNREWWPTGSYSYRSGAVRLIVIHTTEGFTGPNGMYDLAAYFAGDVGASSHVGIDAFHPGLIVEMVSRNHAAWTQCNCNSWCVAVEQCAYASWTRDVWLNQKHTLLENTAEWIAEEAAFFGIPIRKLTPSQAQSGSAGVCYHSDLGSYGCGHADPGAGYPIDIVLEMALNGPYEPIPPTPTEEDEMNTVIVPPGNAPVEVSFDGTPFKTISFYGDATTYQGAKGVIRCAFYREGTASEHSVQTVYVESGRNKPVVMIPPGTGGVSFVRQDELNVTYYPNFGK
jgi:N-acetylmuramoyl-L-alanine amidase